MIKGYEDFIELRRWFMAQLRKIDMSNGHKRYEGIFELTVSYPDFFEYTGNQALDKPDFFEIKLHCYVIGPHRNYEWRGNTMEEVIKKCKNDLIEWCKNLS